jgi:hypothetical protein
MEGWKEDAKEEKPKKKRTWAILSKDRRHARNFWKAKVAPTVATRDRPTDFFSRTP